MKKNLTARRIALLAVGVLLLTAAAVCLSVNNPTFNYKSGFYDEPIKLEIDHHVKNAKIYYTTDGSVPDASDNLYVEPLDLTDTMNLPNRISGMSYSVLDSYVPRTNVAKAHVIRAVAVMPWGRRTEIINGTYFVGCDRQALYKDVPVFSLLIEPDDLFDYKRGIFMEGQTYDDWISGTGGVYNSWEIQGNYSNSGQAWEKNVAVEYLPADGECGFAQNMGVRVKGNTSRKYLQKSLKLIARPEYGKDVIMYPVFKEHMRLDESGVVDRYRSITLRNGSNDRNYARIRDPLIQALASDLRFVTQSTRPCVVFINGEYWGVYTLTEEYSDRFFEYHYGINHDNIALIESGWDETDDRDAIFLYQEMVRFITENDMSRLENYQKACEMLDMSGFADYCALQFYIYNRDDFSIDKNWQMWRVKVPEEGGAPVSDGKWRMMLYGTEYSAGLYGYTEDAFEDNISSVLYEEEGWEDCPLTLVLRSLLRSEEFRRELIMSLCNVRNIHCSEKRVKSVLGSLRDEYEPLMPETYERFGPVHALEDSAAYISEQIDQLEAFFMNRHGCFMDIVTDVFDLSDPVRISVRSSDEEKGTVLLEHNALDLSDGFEGQYYKEYALELTALPGGDSVFVGWEIPGLAAELDLSSPDIQIPLMSDLEIMAVFE